MTKSLRVAVKAVETSAAHKRAAAAGSQHQRLLQVYVVLHHVKMLTQS